MIETADLSIRKLAELDAAASPGPWEFGDYNIGRSGPTSPTHHGPTVKESLDHDAWERDPNAQGDGPPLWHSTVHIMQPAADPKYGSSAYTLAIVPGDKPIRDANAALIAATRGRWTALVAALDGLAERWESEEDDYNGSFGVCAEHLRALLDQDPAK